jgi:hypothetical protein
MLAGLLAGAAPAYGHPADRFGTGAPWYVFTVASVQWNGAMTADTGDSHAEVRVAHGSQQAGTGWLMPGSGGAVGGVTIRALRVPFTLTYTVPAASSPSNCTQTALAEIRIRVEFTRTRAIVRARIPFVPRFGQHTTFSHYPLFSCAGSPSASLFEAYSSEGRGGRDLRSTTTRVPIARLRGAAATIGFDYHRSFSDQYVTTDGRWHIVVRLRRVRTCSQGARGFTRCLNGR